MNNDDRMMLALAALTYRGFGNHSEAAIDAALRPWFVKLEREGLGKWDLAWGPAAFRAPTSLFDDAMMYVARRTDLRPGENSHYVVAIRGTNPISLFDWIFGDFWVQLQMDWDAATNSTAKVSASTALGLAIAQHLAAETPPSVGGNLASLGNAFGTALGRFSQLLPELDPRRTLSEPETFQESNLMSRLNALATVPIAEPGLRILHQLGDRFEASTAAVQEDFNRRLFARLLRHVEANQGPGEKLIPFLNRTVEENAKITVTGHSKGGALAVAIALWLGETWATGHRAEIECFSFAGPTAGNAAFAQRYNARLANHTRRIVNPRDAVPQAWDSASLGTLLPLYPALQPAVRGLAKRVEPLGYTHVGGDVIEITSRSTGQGLVQELIHQHLDAYLIDAAFTDSMWNAKSIFGAI